MSATLDQAVTVPDDVTQRLFELWSQDGDSAARNALIDSYLPLAYSLAHGAENLADDPEDLAAAASTGLATAVDRYDPTRGNAFATFAVPTILGELLS